MPSIQINSNSIVYYLHQYWIDVADPRTEVFLLINGGLWKILSVVSIYLLFIKKILPSFMENRKPFILRGPILVYNIMMVCVNAYFFYEVIVGVDFGRRFLDFKYPDRNDYSPRTLRELNLVWWGLISRFADWFDTFFMVLRKKSNQISFLHVYHHTIVPLLGWYSFKMNPLIPAILLFYLCNTAVHVIMYSYYSLALFGPQMKKYLWWKKNITQMQILQFVVCGIYTFVVFFLQSDYPAVIFYVLLSQIFFFLYMFFDFYRHSFKIRVKTNKIKE